MFGNNMNLIKPSTLDNQRGFTIVELLVVIVVIGILAAITIVSYTGISGRATVASLQSDLTNASKRLKMYYTDNGSYPQSLDSGNCPVGPADTRYCLKPSSGNAFTYSSSAPYSSFTLNSTKTSSTVRYVITDSTGPALFSPSWILGLSSTSLESKYVYNADLGSTYMYKTTQTSVSSPQGYLGLDSNHAANLVLVSPQTNSSVDFSIYPAQNACKAIGGRLPNTQELLAIFAAKSSYGNNFQTGSYWSSTEYNNFSAYLVYFDSGNSNGNGKDNSLNIRCVAGG